MVNWILLFCKGVNDADHVTLGDYKTLTCIRSVVIGYKHFGHKVVWIVYIIYGYI